MISHWQSQHSEFDRVGTAVDEEAMSIKLQSRERRLVLRASSAPLTRILVSYIM